jgi:hypothetical protein
MAARLRESSGRCDTVVRVVVLCVVLRGRTATAVLHRSDSKIIGGSRRDLKSLEYQLIGICMLRVICIKRRDHACVGEIADMPILIFQRELNLQLEKSTGSDLSCRHTFSKCVSKYGLVEILWSEKFMKVSVDSAARM